MADVDDPHDARYGMDSIQDAIEVRLVSVEQVSQSRVILRYRATVSECREALDVILKAKEPLRGSNRFNCVDKAEDPA